MICFDLDQSQEEVVERSMREVDAHRKGYVPRIQCPLWVKSRHVQCKTACPLYPQERTLGGAKQQNR